MLASPSQSRLLPPTVDGQIHQLYVTHCLYDEGLSRTAGFAPRASSTRDPLLLRFAQEYPTFELPAGMVAGADAVSDSLCRLALVRLPGGQKALIHSAALPAERHEVEINYRVPDIERFLAQLSAAGIPIEKREDYEYGRFAWIRDPENNRIELFQPLPM